MCGRTELNIEMDEAKRVFGLSRWPILEDGMLFAPRFNIAPSYSTDDKWIVRVSPVDGQREMVAARWWLIPSWWKKPLNELPTSFNARAEDIAQKPMFREAFKLRHCIVPATGWYEFQGESGKKRSFHFGVPSVPVFGFAGIYEEWQSPEGQIVTSYAIVTTEPNEQARAVHDRMPLVLHPGDYATWLDAADPNAPALTTRPYAGELGVYRASGLGNDSRVEGPEVAAPWVEPEERQRSLF